VKYDYECDGCKAIYELEIPMKDVCSEVPCPNCEGTAHRIFSVPQMIVRGEGKNKRSDDNFAPEEMVSIGPTAAKAGFTAKQYERIQTQAVKGDEEVAREVSRRSGNHATQGSDAVRHVGSIPLAKFLSMQKENGGDMPDTEQLKRRGCIFEHEKKNL
jgi:putative FmdB family regulatory protein